MMAMPRTFTPQDLIQLPRLNAQDMVALVTELETVATPRRPLPGGADTAFVDLLAARDALRTELRDLGSQDPVDLASARAADSALDRAWTAFRDWTQSLAQLSDDDHPHAAEARLLLVRLFPDGVTFVQKQYKEEWVESQTRLDRIAAEQLEGAIDRLGGTAFLKAIRRAHEAYGKVLHITVERPAPLNPKIRTAMAAVDETLRIYATQVAASVARGKSDTEERARVLLAPLMVWEGRRRGRATEEPEATPPVQGAPV
jgi:hypothetical protein